MTEEELQVAIDKLILDSGLPVSAVVDVLSSMCVRYDDMEDETTQ